MRTAHRVFGALFGLWFTVLTVLPSRVNSCPMHDALGMADQHASHAGHHMPSGHEHGTPTTSHACTCLGACASAAPPSAPVATTFAVVETQQSDPGLREITRSIEPVEFATPFANGPPRA